MLDLGIDLAFDLAENAQIETRPHAGRALAERIWIWRT
jgi:hypothetical protein